MNRNVIVTGSGQGIGYAIAQAFDQQGDRVFIFDMSKDAAEAAAQSLGERCCISSRCYR